jgi:hypothetical protein
VRNAELPAHILLSHLHSGPLQRGESARLAASLLRGPNFCRNDGAFSLLCPLPGLWVGHEALDDRSTAAGAVVASADVPVSRLAACA